MGDSHLVGGYNLRLLLDISSLSSAQLASREEDSDMTSMENGRSRYKIVKTDAELKLPWVMDQLASSCHVVHLPADVTEEELGRELRDADCLLMCYEPIRREVLESAQQLKGIVKYGVGIDAIDFSACYELGIPVVNIPDYATATVAEAAFALMIGLAKQHKAITRALDNNGWAWPEPEYLGWDLTGKTLGLVGLGKIGRAMARMAGHGFQMRLIAYDPYVSEEVMQELGVTKVDDLRSLLGESDVVSLHAVLNDETHHLIGREELMAMGPQSYLINVSRGALVDEAALTECLTTGKIAGAGLDVFSYEPLERDGKVEGPLYDLPNVLMTPHLAFYTHEALHRLEEETAARVLEILEQRPIRVSSHDPRLRSQDGFEHRVRLNRHRFSTLAGGCLVKLDDGVIDNHSDCSSSSRSSMAPSRLYIRKSSCPCSMLSRQ